MNIVQKAFFSVALALGFTSAMATGVTTSTTIATMTTTNYGVLLFTMTNGSIPGTPGCNSVQRFAIDTTSTATNSRMIAAAALSAFSTGKTVVIVGTGACTIDSSSENAQSVIVYQ